MNQGTRAACTLGRLMALGLKPYQEWSAEQFAEDMGFEGWDPISATRLVAVGAEDTATVDERREAVFETYRAAQTSDPQGNEVNQRAMATAMANCQFIHGPSGACIFWKREWGAVPDIHIRGTITNPLPLPS